MPRQKPLSYLFLFTSLFAYLILGYYIQRYETTFLFVGYIFLFAVYVWIVKNSSSTEIKFWVYSAILFRFSLLFALPSLSDDFYRFIWDGRLIANGVHPFAELPGFHLEQQIPGLNQWLYNHLNSQEYFTVYPPFAQFIFWISAVIFPDSVLGCVVVMKLFILMAEIGSLVLIRKLLMAFGVNGKNLLVYALNPLVILELMGNLHFEAFVIFFILLSFYLLYQSKIWQAGISIGLSVAAKLLPVIFLPLFIIRIGLKRSFWLYLFVFITVVLLFLPLLHTDVIAGFSESLGLYFKRFEFNGSIYYMVREYGFYTKGYNTIHTVGWKLGIFSMLGILLISLWPYKLKRAVKFKFEISKYNFPAVVAQIPQVMMWVMLFYFLMTTTVHPWYITTLLMVSVFTHYRFAMVWSALVFLTYSGYTVNGFHENLMVVAIEYVVVIGFLLYELIWKEKLSY